MHDSNSYEYDAFAQDTFAVAAEVLPPAPAVVVFAFVISGLDLLFGEDGASNSLSTNVTDLLFVPFFAPSMPADEEELFAAPAPCGSFPLSFACLFPAAAPAVVLLAAAELEEEEEVFFPALFSSTTFPAFALLLLLAAGGPPLAAFSLSFFPTSPSFSPPARDFIFDVSVLMFFSFFSCSSTWCYAFAKSRSLQSLYTNPRNAALFLLIRI